MSEGRFSHGLVFCTKLAAALNTIDEKPTEENGLMTVDQFIQSFEKKHKRYLTTHTRTVIMRKE